jgi:hypothetical protein
VALTIPARALVVLDNYGMFVVRQEWRVGRAVGNSERADKTKRYGECCDVRFHVRNPFFVRSDLRYDMK